MITRLVLNKADNKYIISLVFSLSLSRLESHDSRLTDDDVIKWKYFPRWLREGNHQLPMDSPHKGQWPGALMLCLICASTGGSANIRDAGYLRRHRAHYDVTIMKITHNGRLVLLSTQWIWRSNCVMSRVWLYLHMFIFKCQRGSKWYTMIMYKPSALNKVISMELTTTIHLRCTCMPANIFFFIFWQRIDKVA